jgi:hypothetical protein
MWPFYLTIQIWQNEFLLSKHKKLQTQKFSFYQLSCKRLLEIPRLFAAAFVDTSPLRTTDASSQMLSL